MSQRRLHRAGTLAQLAAAPAAGADVSDIITELDGTAAVAQTAFNNASEAFLAGNVPYGLDYGFGALDTSLLSYFGDLAYGGVESLEGVSGPYPSFGFYYIDNPVPVTLAEATADATARFDLADADFASALTAFGDGNFSSGATDVFGGIGALVESSQIDFIGLSDALLGSI